MKRVLTSLLLIPAALYLTLFAPFPLLLAATIVFAAGCYYEFRGLAAGHGYLTSAPAGYVAGVAVLVLPGDMAGFFVLLALMSLSLALFSGAPRQALTRAAVLLLGIVYVFGCWRFAPQLHRLNPYWLLFALMVNWAGDISAYYVGRAVGRHKMAAAISPGKTWEGAAASLAAAALFGWIYLTRLIPQVQPASAVFLAMIANAAGQIGDLAESAIKRGAGVKDSGNLLPGHGGLLDRLDSTMFTLPVVYAVVTLWRY